MCRAFKKAFPNLIEFAKTHSNSKEKFNIIAVRENRLDESGDWKDFHTKTLKLEKTLWHTTPPFPIVYDETTKMTSDWGIHEFPTYALIDPHGNLIRGGDLSMLKAKIDKAGAQGD